MASALFTELGAQFNQDGIGGHSRSDPSHSPPSKIVGSALKESVKQLAILEKCQFVRIDNLTDRKYVGSVIVNDGNNRFFEPGLGRAVSVGVEVARQF